MNKYTEADYRRVNQSIVEDMVDQLIGKWHNEECNPLEARVCRNLASALESLRNPDDFMVESSLRVWVSAANAEANNKTKEKAQ